jgi:hypothetical protein
MTKQEFLAGVPFTVRGCLKAAVFQFVPGSHGEAGWVRRVDLGGHHYCSVEFVTRAAANCYKWLFMKCCRLVLRFEDCEPIPAPRIGEPEAIQI